jgi:GTPase SAR1 family protein
VTRPTPSYQGFARLRERALGTLGAIAQVFRGLEAAPRAEQLVRTQKALQSDTFKVLVVGEFKRGKSTLINALLGQSVLPAKVAPCTAVITRVCYGERKRAVLHFKDGRRPVGLDLEASTDALKKYITIQGDAPADEGADPGVSASPYAAAEVYYPLPLCRNSVEIVDSPGLNEHRTRTEVTKSFLAEADAMVLVLSCEQALSESERRFIDADLQDRDLRDVFFIWNRFDVVRDSPADFADIQQLSRTKLEPKVRGRARVFYVAARDALEGRLRGRAELLAQSNVPALETALETFLSSERGRVKLRGPLRTAENAVQEALLQLLPHRENLFRQPLEEVRRKLEQQRPRLDEAERQRERILRSVDRRGEAMAREIEASLRTLVAELEAGLARQAQAQPVSTWETMRSQTKAKEKLARALEEGLSREVKRWQKGVLQPLAETHLRELETDLDEQARSFFHTLDSIKAAFETQLDAKAVEKPEEITALNRLAGAALGLVGGAGSIMEGATMGVGRAASGLGVNIAAALGLSVLGFGLPVIIPVLLAIGTWRTLTGARNAAENLRAAVVKELSAALRREQPKMEREIGEQLAAILAQIRKGLEERTTVLVDEVRGQVQAVIQERQQHEENSKQVLEELSKARTVLLAEAKALNELKSEIEQI